MESNLDKVAKTVYVAFRTTELEREALQKMAVRDGISVSGVIRRSIRNEAARRGIIVDLLSVCVEIGR